MIRTFEDLFEKMKSDGKEWIPLHGIYHSYQLWYQEMQETSGSRRSTARNIKNRDVQTLMGYLSCLRDMGYISQYEYDQLWGSLDSL